eukprot:62958-Chlamydomonas_euryale.AAC.2
MPLCAQSAWRVVHAWRMRCGAQRMHALVHTACMTRGAWPVTCVKRMRVYANCMAHRHAVHETPLHAACMACRARPWDMAHRPQCAARPVRRSAVCTARPTSDRYRLFCCSEPTSISGSDSGPDIVRGLRLRFMFERAATANADARRSGDVPALPLLDGMRRMSCGCVNESLAADSSISPTTTPPMLTPWPEPDGSMPFGVRTRTVSVARMSAAGRVPSWPETGA